MNALKSFLSTADLVFMPHIFVNMPPICLDFMITASTPQRSRDVGDVQMFNVWLLKKKEEERNKKKDSLYGLKNNRRTWAQLTISVCVGFCYDEPSFFVVFFFLPLSKNKFPFSFVLVLYARRIIISLLLEIIWANEWCFRKLPLLCNVKDPKLSLSSFH